MLYVTSNAALAVHVTFLVLLHLSEMSSSQLYPQLDCCAARAVVTTTVTGVTLDPVCPALGATVLEAALVSVDRFQVFGLPVHSLDQFNSRVTRGPGSDWTVALQQPQLMTLNSQTGSSSSSSNEGPLVQLLSAARGRLSGGHVVLEGLSIAAPPGSELSMQLTARSMQAGVSQVSDAPGMLIDMDTWQNGGVCFGRNAGRCATLLTDIEK